MAGMADMADEIRPPVASTGPLGWVRANLLDTWYNALLTVGVLAALYYLVRGFGGWALQTAEWAVLTQNLQVLLVGQYPDEQLWRTGVVMLALPFVLGLGCSVWPGFCRRLAISLAVAAPLVAVLPVEFASLGPGFRVYLLLNTVLVGAGWLAGRYTVLGNSRWVLGTWLVLFLGGLVFLRGFPESEALPFVGTKQWGGLMVTLLLSQAGIVVSFPLGILFALGRRSSMAFVRVTCVVYIEVLRGTPILALLFVTQVLLPLLLPDWMDMDRLTRGLIALILNNSAYMAENIRGGLQSVPSGQLEAARALGMKVHHITARIVLPQALRNVLPAIVGQFIILFKDTAVISLLGLLDFLGTANAILSGRRMWFNSEIEMFVFVAAVYWVFTYAMTSVSRAIEKSMSKGVG